MTQQRVQRKLAAILAADVVGYSRLMGQDEEGTHAALKAHLEGVFEPCLAENHGRVVKRTGDGLLAEFPSVVDAVRCSMLVQRAMRDCNLSVPTDRRIEFRIGVNVGDVIVEGDDLYGDGVNVAARLEALAEPGGICVSADVYRQVRSSLDLDAADLGEQLLKNIAEPVRVYKVHLSDERQVTSIDAHVLPLPDRPSVAVLPFDNLSGQVEETYLSDGITEDIITGLARFRSLFVVARNSSFSFRGKSIELAEIGRRLGVSFILEGSVRRGGERLRITAQLVEAASGMHLWAEHYDRNLDDVFTVQDEVAQTIVATLVGRIEEARLQRSFRKPTESLPAYECVLRGLAHFRGYAEDDNQKAYDLFGRAVAIDPGYALAHAYRALVLLGLHGHAAAPADVLDEAFAMATRALELDPLESGCHRALGLIWMYRRDYERAEYHTRRAHELNPNDADRRMSLGNLLAMRGKPEEGLDWMQSALRLNPLHPTWYNPQLGMALYSLRRYGEAAQAFRHITNPGYWSRARLAACCAQLGDIAAAEAQREAILRQRPDFSTADFLRADILLERADDREHLREGLLKAGLPD